MITIRHLSYTYKKSDRKVLNDLCADFEAGKIQVLIGKNGSGKTTLFDLIAGVIQRPPTSGVDPEARIRILRRIELLAQAGRIVLLSSHTLHDFQKVDCNIHLLNQGRFPFEGTYDQFVKSYSDANPDDIFAERLTQ